MIILIAFFACVLAGFVNGSYAFPVKHMPHLPKETIWFYFSFVAFLLMPVLSIFLVDSQAFSLLVLVPIRPVLALMVGGFIFGMGMVLFTLCMHKIGIGIAFILNISLGTIGGSLLPLFLLHTKTLLTPFGYANMLAFVLFILAILFTTHAVSLRDATKNKLTQQKNTLVGLLLGVLSGIFCAMQGFSYAYSWPFFVAAATTNVSPYAATLLPWLIIFAAAFVPYALYQLYEQITRQTFTNIFKHGQGKNRLLILLMGILYFASILIYSKVVLMLGTYGQILGWPLFMIFIILSANFWSLVQGEWKHAATKSKLIFALGVSIIILAIVVLGYATSIRA